MVDFCRQDLCNRPVYSGNSAYLWLIVRRACWIGLFMAVALAYGWMRRESLELSYQTATIAKDNEELRRLVSALKVEHRALVSPIRIEQEARQRGFIRFDEGVAIVEGLPVSIQPEERLMARNLNRAASR